LVLVTQEPPMPRFHFDVVENGVTATDDEGMDGLTVQGAKLEAARSAAEMMRDRAGRKAEPANISIIVRDGTPIPVCTVTVALTLQ
jgi:hypothetical protein